MAEFKHYNPAAPILGQLNSGGIRLVEKKILETIEQLRKANVPKPIRILDIGCGASPYLRSLPLEGFSLTLLDKDKETVENHWIKAFPQYDYSLFSEDFLKLDTNSFIAEDRPYDIVIFAFVLHELRAQLALQALNHSMDRKEKSDHLDPAEIVFKQLIAAPFVGKDTIIILSDIFHWPYWDAKLLDEARMVQLEKLGHADPASAFLLGAEVLRHAACANLDLVTYDVTASVDLNLVPVDPSDPLNYLCTHPKYGKIFGSRRAFCALLKRKVQHDSNDQTPVDLSFSKCSGGLPEVIQEGIAGNKNLQRENHEYLQQLRKLLNGSAPIETSTYDTYLGKGLFSSLSQSAGELAQSWFATTQVATPKAISFWFGMNSLILNESRYALRDGTTWQCHHVHLEDEPASVKVEIGYNQDWPFLCFNHFSSPDAVKYIVEPNSWLTDLSPPSVYRWMTSHSMQYPAWRSVSIVCPLEADSNSRESPAHLVEDALILQKYSLPSTPLEGHLLIALPGHQKDSQFLGVYLDKICSGYYCSENPEATSITDKARTMVLHAIGAVYIDSIFLARGHTSDKSPDIETLLKGFEQRWLSNPKVRFFNGTTDAEELERYSAEEIVLLPERMKDQIYRFIERVRAQPPDVQKLPVVWTYFVVRQPGSNESPIATIMFMSDRPFHPALLEIFKAQFQEVFFSIREVEAERKVRLHAAAETKAKTTQSMLSSFGHDGKRPAEIIRQVLKSESSLSPEQRICAAASIAEGLITRLSGYTRLVDDGTSRSQKHLTAWKEGQDKNVSKFCSINSIFKSELALTLLRLAVDTSGKWPDLRLKLGIEELASQLVDAYPDLDKIFGVLRGKVFYSFEGPELKTPELLNSRLIGTTSPRVFHALHFIFAEILTNAFRHEFPDADGNILNIFLTATLVPVSSSSAIPHNAVLANFCCMLQPSYPENRKDQISGSTHGLDSLANAARAIGASLATRLVEFYDPELGKKWQDKPRAFFLRENGSIVWNISNIPCFIGG